MNPNVRVIGEYADTKTPILTECLICGNQWNSTAQRLMRGHTCKRCAMVRRDAAGRGNRKKTTQEFVQQMSIIAPTINILSEYINARTHVRCRCAVCGHEWQAKPSNLESGFGCPVCAVQSVKDAQRKSVSVFVDELALLNPKLEYLGGYENNKSKVLLKCRVCGNQWAAMPINILRKDGKATGCPACKTSHGEEFICSWLHKNHLQFESQMKFEGLTGVGGRKLSYDFFVPCANTLVEYQGEYHDHTARIQSQQEYDIQVEHDVRKARYAKENGYHLLYIWYYDNMEEKLNTLLHNITDPVTTTAT